MSSLSNLQFSLKVNVEFNEPLIPYLHQMVAEFSPAETKILRQRSIIQGCILRYCTLLQKVYSLHSRLVLLCLKAVFLVMKCDSKTFHSTDCVWVSSCKNSISCIQNLLLQLVCLTVISQICISSCKICSCRNVTQYLFIFMHA